MPNNFLVTGPPGCGKSTLISEIVNELRSRGYSVGGFYTPEIRHQGRRIGFQMVDIATGTAMILAHVNQPTGPSVSRYRVNIDHIDRMTSLSLERALHESDLIVIDEIAPMELFSPRFKRAVQQILDSPKPLLAAVHYRTTTGFIGALKKRPDIRLWVLSPSNRPTVRSELLRALTALLPRRTPQPPAPRGRRS